MAENGKGDESTREFARALKTQPPRNRRTRAAAEEGENKAGKMKMVTGMFDEAVSRQLKGIGAREGRTMLDLLAEALNMLFEDRGEPPIARGTNKSR